MCLVGIVCFQVQISATRRSLDQGVPTDYGVSECDRGKKERRSKLTMDTDT
jgi:hypothetical protein